MENEELTHYGIRGMKWGHRKGGLATRARGALADQNQRNTAVVTRARENRSVGAEEKFNRTVAVGLSGGTKRLNKNLDKKLGHLAEQRKRVESGKLAAKDVLQLVANVSVLDLVVSRRDNKG